MVLSVTRLTGFSSSSLPAVEILILDAGEVCADESLTLFDDPPEPISSSEPFDVRPVDEDLEEDLTECLSEGVVIDCDVGVVENSEGGTFAVFEDPGEVTQTVAGFLTIPAGGVVGGGDVKLTMKHVTPPPAPFGDIAEDDQIPFFLDITAEASGGGPVVFDPPGAALVLCQPPDLGVMGSDHFIPDALHEFLKIFQVTGTGTVILDSKLDDDSCPGSLHGGLVTIGGRGSGEGSEFILGGLFGFSGFGAVLHFAFTSMSAGIGHTCGVTTSDAALCWGRNDVGQLGDTTNMDRTTPFPVFGGLSFASTTARGFHTCGVETGTGDGYCWGFGTDGQLGDGNTNDSSSPLQVTGGHTFANMSAGIRLTCGVTTGSAAYCWGLDNRGQLGNGSPLSPSASPVLVSGGLSFASVNASNRWACGVETITNDAYCWGRNEAGQLGNSTLVDSSMPVAVSGGKKFVSLTSGATHTCGLEVGGDVYCWGFNDVGQLGDGTMTTSSTPVKVSTALTFASVSSRNKQNCAVTATGAAHCWGLNAAGQLGDGSTTDSLTPVAVSGGHVFTNLVVGTNHVCGVTALGTFCWGGNGRGQLGDGTMTSSSTPIKVSGT